MKRSHGNMSIEAISIREPSVEISRLLSGIFVREVFKYFEKLFSDGHIFCISTDHIIVKVGRLYLLSTVKEVFEGMVFFVNQNLYGRVYKEPLLMEFFEETGGGVLFKIRSMWRDESERGRNYAKDQSISQFVEAILVNGVHLIHIPVTQILLEVDDKQADHIRNLKFVLLLICWSLCIDIKLRSALKSEVGKIINLDAVLDVVHGRKGKGSRA